MLRLSTTCKIKKGDVFGGTFIALGEPFVVRTSKRDTRSHVVAQCSTCGRKGVHAVTARSNKFGCVCAMGRGRNPTHGLTKTRLYRLWVGMKSRCVNPKMQSYPRYGGRGISVCDLWQAFEPFRDWALASGYAAHLQIDRIDNDGDYAPDNCRWVTGKDNTRNKRNNTWIEAFGERKTLAAWAEDSRCAVTRHAIRWRLREGYAPEAAISDPPMPGNKHNHAKGAGK